nr:hypothetical protein [uncultured Ottowia sp.]
MQFMPHRIRQGAAQNAGNSKLLPAFCGFAFLLRRCQQIAIDDIAANLPVVCHRRANFIGVALQGANGVVAQTRRIESDAGRARCQHGGGSQAASQRMPRENHIAFAEYFFGILGQGNRLLILLGFQAGALPGIGGEIAACARTPVVSAAIGHHILALCILINGRVKSGRGVMQVSGRDGDAIALRIHQVIAFGPQTLPSGILQFAFRLGACFVRSVGFVGIVGHHGQLQIPFALRSRAPDAAGKGSVAYGIATAVIDLAGG